MKAFSILETGSRRKNNEDALLALTNIGLFAVADGMGGHNAGEVASGIAIESLKNNAEKLKDIPVDGIEQWVLDTVKEANQAIFERSLYEEGVEGMGTTLTALVIKKDKAVIGHVGDSRIYLWRDGSISLLSEDHSMVNELLRMGQLSEEDARNHPQRNYLSRALGIEKQVDVDCLQFEVQGGDVYLLCTDGFSNMVEKEEIAREFSAAGGWQEHLENLKLLVLQRGAPDNFTAVCCIMEN
ncbi:protein serine/threonine phosphatase [Syntrophobotulus glycolicus DSM 8271]|uniref:Protein serine/threonine phosphatase n=1 Tax=Syntrophobotulus glycolicus (strain DSM 8271 / FlGlyR) TaxID=645991 RepID=F0SUQ9_SYNGF|nr:Stp1/IreP family PP2C-type Ser/Thr phosphatase [Syntrophobotulus glycolicus]ADY56625.1 protein serine/threonine phosphatase [Syntrophobotulus glycolicus DSM 8271]